MLNKSYITDLTLILVAVIWALNFTVVKVSLDQIEPLAFNALRFIFAVSVLWTALRSRGQRLRVQKKHLLPLVLLGLLGNLVYQMLFIIGIDFTFSANAAVMLGTIPVWVAVFSHFFSDEQMNRLKAIGVVSAFIGVGFIMAGGKNPLSFGSETFLGDVITLLAAMTWAAYTILSKKYLNIYSTLQYSTFMAIVGFLVLFPIGIPDLLQMDFQQVSWGAYGGVVYSGALSVGLAYLIWNNGIIKIGAVRTAAYQNLVPVLGLLFGVILLNEDLTLKQYIGAFFVITGIVLTRYKK